MIHKLTLMLVGCLPNAPPIYGRAKEVKQAWWAPRLTPPGASMVALIAPPMQRTRASTGVWTGSLPDFQRWVGDLARWAPEVDASEPSGASMVPPTMHRSGAGMLTQVLVLAWCRSPPIQRTGAGMMPMLTLVAPLMLAWCPLSAPPCQPTIHTAGAGDLIVPAQATPQVPMNEYSILS